MSAPVVCVVTKELREKGLVIRQPGSLPIRTNHERPDPRDVHLFDRRRAQPRLREKRREIEIRLEAEVQRERRDRALEPGKNGLSLRKWFRNTSRPPGRHTRRISRVTASGSGTQLMKYGA